MPMVDGKRVTVAEYLALRAAPPEAPVAEPEPEEEPKPKRRRSKKSTAAAQVMASMGIDPAATEDTGDEEENE